MHVIYVGKQYDKPHPAGLGARGRPPRRHGTRGWPEKQCPAPEPQHAEGKQQGSYLPGSWCKHTIRKRRKRMAGGWREAWLDALFVRLRLRRWLFWCCTLLLLMLLAAAATVAFCLLSLEQYHCGGVWNFTSWKMRGKRREAVGGRERAFEDMERCICGCTRACACVCRDALKV